MFANFFDTRANIAGGSNLTPTPCSLYRCNMHTWNWTIPKTLCQHPANFVDVYLCKTFQTCKTDNANQQKVVPASATACHTIDILAQASHGDTPLKVVNAVPPAITDSSRKKADSPRVVCSDETSSASKHCLPLQEHCSH